MSTEEPTNTRGLYTRKPYDPSRHCGQPMRRDPEFFKEKVEKYDRQIEELRAVETEGGTLSIYQKKRLKQKFTSRKFAADNLRKIEEQGPDNRPCVKMKGQSTDHPGVGHCKFHCECKGREGGHLSYSSRKSKDRKLSALIDEIDQASMDVLNLEPDVVLLRAKMRLFLDDKQDFSPETVRSLTILSDQLRKTVETINDKKFKSMITREMFDLVMFRMGDVVSKYVSDPEVLEKILLDWAKISVDASNKRVSKQIQGAIGEASI